MATASKWTQTCLHHCANACAIIKGDNDPDGQGPADDSNGGGGGSATLKRPPSEPSGGTAVLEPPEERANEPTPGASKEDIDRLKRMFGSSGA